MSPLLLVVLSLLAPEPGATYVIAAGVETYDDARISTLKFAVADATSIAAAFRASGVPREQVMLLTSERREPHRPSRGGLLAALQQVRARAEMGDRVVFFFAGHGVEEGEEQYLLTVDTRRDLMPETALPMSLVNRALQGLQASKLLFVIDACRNAPDAARGDENAELTEGLVRGVRPRLLPEGATRVPDLVATLLSCDVGQRAYEAPERGHGIFTLCLLDGLRGKAVAADGQVHLSRLTSFVEQEMRTWCARTGRWQTPRLVNPTGGDMVLLTPPEEPLVSLDVRNRSLAEVVSELAEQAEAQVVLGAGVDPRATVTGRLEMQPLSTALKVLVLAHRLAVRKVGETYLIEGPTGLPPVPTEPPAAAIPDFTAADPQPPGWPEIIPWPPVNTPGLRFRVHPKDGMPQVYIPAGEFLMGSTGEQAAAAGETLARFLEAKGYDEETRRRIATDERQRQAYRASNRKLFAAEEPQRSIYVSAFWIDLHEVTNQQYQAFLAATRHAPAPLRIQRTEVAWTDWAAATGPAYPATAPVWEDANAYAVWAGRALPTEAQWEKAARSGATTAYPWGDEPSPDRANGNWAGRSFEGVIQDLALAAKLFRPVAQYPPNRFGLYDAIGNMAEWCRGYFLDRYYAVMPARDPQGPPARTRYYRHALRGGACVDIPVMLRVAYRTNNSLNAGLRCVSEEP